MIHKSFWDFFFLLLFFFNPGDGIHPWDEERRQGRNQKGIFRLRKGALAYTSGSECNHTTLESSRETTWPEFKTNIEH